MIVPCMRVILFSERPSVMGKLSIIKVLVQGPVKVVRLKTFISITDTNTISGGLDLN